MALQGTLESFPLDDVVALLASQAKTGALVIDAGSRSGTVWFDDGRLVRAEAATARPGATIPVTLFEMLRSDEGGLFAFEAGAVPSVAAGDQPSCRALPALDEARGLVVEWERLLAVVPGLVTPVSLVAEPPTDEVRLTWSLWEVVVAIGAGSTAAAIAESLALDDVAVGRAIEGLLALGVVERTEVAAPVTVEPGPEPAPEGAGPEPEAVETDGVEAQPEVVEPEGAPEGGEPVDETTGPEADDAEPTPAAPAPGPVVAVAEPELEPVEAIVGMLDLGEPISHHEPAHDEKILVPAASAVREPDHEARDRLDAMAQDLGVAAAAPPPDIARQLSLLSPAAASAVAVASGWSAPQ